MLISTLAQQPWAATSHGVRGGGARTEGVQIQGAALPGTCTERPAGEQQGAHSLQRGPGKEGCWRRGPHRQSLHGTSESAVPLSNQRGSKKDLSPRFCEEESPSPPTSKTRWGVGKAHLLMEEDRMVLSRNSQRAGTVADDSGTSLSTTRCNVRGKQQMPTAQSTAGTVQG